MDSRAYIGIPRNKIIDQEALRTTVSIVNIIYNYKHVLRTKLITTLTINDIPTGLI